MSTLSDRRNRLRDAPRWVHALALGSFSAITLVLLVLYYLYRDTDVWYLWMGEPLKTKHAFAEAIRGSIFRTRANTWSNLGFIFVGLYIVAYSWWDARRETTPRDPYAVRHPALMALFGVACIVLGFGSGAMHAAMMSWGHRADVYGMFIVLAALIALQWGRWLPSISIANRSWPTWPILAIVATVGSMFLLMNSKSFGGDIAIFVTLLILTWLNLGVDTLRGKFSQQWRWQALAGLSLVVAYYIWRVDSAGQFSAPESWVQGHAIWHILNAVTLGAMAIFYWSEIPREPKGNPVEIEQQS